MSGPPYQQMQKLIDQQAKQIERLEREISAYHNYLANNGYGLQLHDIKKNIEAAQPQKGN